MAAKKPQKPSFWPNHSPREDLPPVEDRVALICDMMRNMVWVRGRTGKELAKTWGLSEGTVSQYAAEAWRIVKAEVESPETLRAELGVAMGAALRMAHGQQNPTAMAKVADVFAKISGAHAVQKSEVVISEATPENARKIISNLFSGGRGNKTDGGEGDK
jgi:hypothetical protein